MGDWAARLTDSPGVFGWLFTLVVAPPLALYLRRTRARVFAWALFAILLAIARRPGFASAATLAILALIAPASRLKVKYTGMMLHAYDFVHFLRNRAALGFFVGNYHALAASLAAAVLAFGLSASLLGYWEPPAIPLWGAVANCLAALTTLALLRRKEPQNPWRFFGSSHHLAIFVDSVYDSLAAARRGGVFDARPPDADTPSFAVDEPLRPFEGNIRPTIILIQNESTFPPRLYSDRTGDAELSAFFRSCDGREYGLFVETFGGGTWKTEFSVMTGIPAGSYGPFADHVLHWSARNIHHSLPSMLRHCGYSSHAFFAGSKDFVNSDRFFRSIGFQNNFDHDNFDIRRYREQDIVYYRNAVDWLEVNIREQADAQLIYIQTMWNHFPHDREFVDNEGALTERRIRHSPFEEYLRRLYACRKDYDWLRTELSARFPDRPFLIVRFGDHQPPFTAEAPRSASDDSLDRRYRTFFAIDGVNFSPLMDPETPETIEPAYLGAVIFRAAGLPLDAVTAARRELMIRHNGKLFYADDTHDSTARFNGRLVETGMVTRH